MSAGYPGERLVHTNTVFHRSKGRFKGCQVRYLYDPVGGLEGFATDVDIPLKYGVDQCVGDTLCAGGIIYGQRGIAEILDICKDIRELGAPDVLLLNYSNPMAMLTAGLLEAFEKLPSIVARKRYGPTCFAVLAIHHRIERPFK